MSRAWIHQDPKQVKKVGKEKASWYVGWLDPDGKRRCKSFGRGADGKRLAGQYKRKVEAELMTGTYQSANRKTWAEFREEYDKTILEGKAPGYRREITIALSHFERITKPVKMRSVTANAIARFVAARLTERGMQPKSTVAPATINKDLRHLRAVLKKAQKWGYLSVLPEFRDEFVREPSRLPTYMTPEHFAAIYGAANVARFPRGLPYPPADWWRALLMMAYMTGWRISALLSLKRADVDFEAGTAVTRAEDNKGKRDQAIELHPVVLDRLKAIPSFELQILPWQHCRRMLFTQFARIQKAAVVKPAGKKWYGFHDMRRGFATMNADRLSADALQALMQHKDYQTTQRYINVARQLKPATHGLYVPPVASVATG
jgi:integrase